MTYPSPASFAALTFPTAADLNTLRDGINDIVASGLGNVGTSVVAIQTDFSTVATLCTVTVNVVSGRKYLITTALTGTQVTSTGTPTVKLLIAGTEVYRLLSGVSLTATTVTWASVAWLYVAASTTSVTFSTTAQSTAGAFRIAANASQMLVSDKGTI